MANLKEIRTRIASVKTTRQVTSAMKMVSAAKLKKAQDAILQIRPYADKLRNMLEMLEIDPEKQHDSVYAQLREPDKVLIVIINSDRGLCGAFNDNVNKRAMELALYRYPKQLKKGKLWFLPIGKHAVKFLKFEKLPSVKANELPDHLDFESSTIISTELLNGFASKKYDRIELVYNVFKNAAVQLVANEQFLPVETRVKRKTAFEEHYDFIYEPSHEYLAKELIPKLLRIQFYKALLDSNAAEHGARMTAMHKATDNATELIQELTLTFNKARQAAITNEILEVTNGAEALNG